MKKTYMSDVIKAHMHLTDKELLQLIPIWEREAISLDEHCLLYAIQYQRYMLVSYFLNAYYPVYPSALYDAILVHKTDSLVQCLESYVLNNQVNIVSQYIESALKTPP